MATLPLPLPERWFKRLRLATAVPLGHLPCIVAPRPAGAGGTPEQGSLLSLFIIRYFGPEGFRFSGLMPGPAGDS